MALRNLSLPTDLKELGPMLAESFQYPENPDWSVQDDERESLIEDINSLRRWWWIVQIAQVFSKKMRELLPGKVWIEDGKIAGAVLYQRRGSSDNWLIGTVATHPDYRRRGIARKLVEASMEDIKSKQAQSVVLDVIDANLPAYQLYTSLGFEHYSGNLDLEFTPTGVIPEPEFPTEYRLVPTSYFDWEDRYQIMKRITPKNLQQYEPITEALFRQPGFMRLIIPLFNMAQKMEEKIIHRRTYRQRGEGRLFPIQRTQKRQGTPQHRHPAGSEACTACPADVRICPAPGHQHRPKLVGGDGTARVAGSSRRSRIQAGLRSGCYTTDLA